MKILLIAGGWSSERDVSLAGANNIREALLSLGHHVTFLDLQPQFNNLLAEASKHDFAFINLHGSPGEDGIVQAMLDVIGCPYQGSGPAASFLALNKAASKQIFRRAGLPTADWEFLVSLPPPGWRPGLPFPLFVKSNTGGSSLCLGRAADMGELESRLTDILSENVEAIIESEIPGKEITCGILGDEPLPPILIEPVSGPYFDFQSKYARGGAREICPAPIGNAALKKVQELALRAHRALGLKDYSRSDFILGDDGSFTLLEVNTLPGMTSTSLVPQEAAQIGLSFPALLQKLIDLGMKK